MLACNFSPRSPALPRSGRRGRVLRSGASVQTGATIACKPVILFIKELLLFTWLRKPLVHVLVLKQLTFREPVGNLQRCFLLVS